MAIDLIILDCDGVLIDSEVLSCDALIAALAACGVAVDRDFVFQHCIGHSFPEVVTTISRLHGLRLPESFAETYRSILFARFEKSLKPAIGAEAMLKALDIPFCVATSSSAERAERSLATAGLGKMGAPVFSASMVERGKPAPDLFLLAAGSFGTRPGNCLVIEDSMPGILAARAAGMMVWRFTGGSHFKLGFGAGDPALADAEFGHWHEFITLLRRPVPKAADAL
jgi:HAD superfamily hydrolase (TIGR01509 family)